MSARAFAALILIALGGCGGGADKPRAEPAADARPALGVALSDEERGKLGIELGDVGAATFQPTVDGAARIVDAQTVIAAMAELDKASAEARTSDAALERARNLYRADKTVSAETLEAAERQAAADHSQLAVARARASLEFGAAPWLASEHRDSLLAALAGGETILVSASFPGGLPAERPANLALRRIGTQISELWVTTELWTGPADPSVPGPTLLALVSSPKGLSYGERLIASVAAGAETAGSAVPASAVVLAGGEAWCYVAESDEVLARRRVDLTRPVPQGYFQTSGFQPGERVVVAGAGLLLAREIGGGAETD
jgi:membrane fusion protein, multidrug efflux system